MRQLLITYGAHLKGTYKGTNLVLVGMDGNNQIIPIVTGVSQGEIGESWTWFLLKFKECIDTSVHTLSDWATHKVIDRMQKSANWKVYRIQQGKVYQCPDGLQVIKAPNMNFPEAGRLKNTNRIKSHDEKPIQVRCSRCTVCGHTRASCHEPIPNYQRYEATYSNNHGRSQEYAQAYNNMIGRSQEYEPTYTNMIGRSQEYEPAYNNMIGRLQ
uniref:Transposase, MuDR, MULE transposase domain protein n=1 Tax=Tanacetum cinerariifolium TaxID=118510 RepID=A0A699HLD5_TANCI|nr:transposase, MuDR, MULE transposase domain protein [Tanacetum cinerariifolium]